MKNAIHHRTRSRSLTWRRSFILYCVHNSSVASCIQIPRTTPSSTLYIRPSTTATRKVCVCATSRTGRLGAFVHTFFLIKYRKFVWQMYFWGQPMCDFFLFLLVGVIKLVRILRNGRKESAAACLVAFALARSRSICSTPHAVR